MSRSEDCWCSLRSAQWCFLLLSEPMGPNASWIDLCRWVTKHTHTHLSIAILTCWYNMVQWLSYSYQKYTLLHSSSQFTDMKRRAKQRLEKKNVYNYCLHVCGIALEEWKEKPALISCPEPVRFPGSPTLDEIVNYLRPCFPQQVPPHGVQENKLATWTWTIITVALNFEGSFSLRQFQEFLPNEYAGSRALRCMDGLSWLIDAYWKV